MEDKICNKFDCEYLSGADCLLGEESCSSDCDYFNECNACRSNGTLGHACEE